MAAAKKRKKRSLIRAALVAGTQQYLSSLYYLDVYGSIFHLDVIKTKDCMGVKHCAQASRFNIPGFSYFFTSGGSTVVDDSTTDHEIEGLNPASHCLAPGGQSHKTILE